MIEVFRCSFTPIPLPLMRRPVAAGFPSPADDFIEDEIDLTRLLISNRPATFLIRVRGSSMIGARLNDGDLAIVDRSLSPQSGDVVVVDINGDRSFKVWRKDEVGLTLCFANPELEAFTLDAEATVKIWGVVAGSISPGRRAGL